MERALKILRGRSVSPTRAPVAWGDRGAHIFARASPPHIRETAFITVPKAYEQPEVPPQLMHFLLVEIALVVLVRGHLGR